MILWIYVFVFGLFFLFLCNNGITHGYGLWNHDQRVFLFYFFRFVFCGWCLINHFVVFATTSLLVLFHMWMDDVGVGGGVLWLYWYFVTHTPYIELDRGVVRNWVWTVLWCHVFVLVDYCEVKRLMSWTGVCVCVCLGNGWHVLMILWIYLVVFVLFFCFCVTTA